MLYGIANAPVAKMSASGPSEADSPEADAAIGEALTKIYQRQKEEGTVTGPIIVADGQGGITHTDTQSTECIYLPRDLLLLNIKRLVQTTLDDPSRHLYMLLFMEGLKAARQDESKPTLFQRYLFSLEECMCWMADLDYGAEKESARCLVTDSMIQSDALRLIYYAFLDDTESDRQVSCALILQALQQVNFTSLTPHLLQITGGREQFYADISRVAINARTNTVMVNPSTGANVRRVCEFVNRAAYTLLTAIMLAEESMADGTAAAVFHEDIRNELVQQGEMLSHAERLLGGVDVSRNAAMNFLRVLHGENIPNVKPLPMAAVLRLTKPLIDTVLDFTEKRKSTVEWLSFSRTFDVHSWAVRTIDENFKIKPLDEFVAEYTAALEEHVYPHVGRLAGVLASDTADGNLKWSATMLQGICHSYQLDLCTRQKVETPGAAARARLKRMADNSKALKALASSLKLRGPTGPPWFPIHGGALDALVPNYTTHLIAASTILVIHGPDADPAIQQAFLSAVLTIIRDGRLDGLTGEPQVHLRLLEIIPTLIKGNERYAVREGVVEVLCNLLLKQHIPTDTICDLLDSLVSYGNQVSEQRGGNNAVIRQILQMGAVKRMRQPGKRGKAGAQLNAPKRVMDFFAKIEAEENDRTDRIIEKTGLLDNHRTTSGNGDSAASPARSDDSEPPAAKRKGGKGKGGNGGGPRISPPPAATMVTEKTPSVATECRGNEEGAEDAGRTRKPPVDIPPQKVSLLGVAPADGPKVDRGVPPPSRPYAAATMRRAQFPLTAAKGGPEGSDGVERLNAAHPTGGDGGAAGGSIVEDRELQDESDVDVLRQRLREKEAEALRLAARLQELKEDNHDASASKLAAELSCLSTVDEVTVFSQRLIQRQMVLSESVARLQSLAIQTQRRLAEVRNARQ
ncbi:unnamed protein product [Vitrella brassicaformis CCMP3155]|uniref:Uncharacterized protein n=1 Tax=Vitrella brassicaformis (strain CCMP3155) TaxID=1169540 RepID=A0A0G4FKL2_VITBC|nr:unnamed protein product [Vitrella brassicaformis CCMP3155]|eukprot:CEM14131.1 unnamed protein product [Vitrella brassicaformis CCMP3155]